MISEQISVLLVEDNPADARLLREWLAELPSALYTLAHADRLERALQRLSEERFDVILLDLSLGEERGIATFLHVHEHAPDVPIVVLTVLDDEALAVQALRAGAQDYLVKGQVDASLLARSMRYAIERHQTLMGLRSLSFIDDLTGLYNRRGFITLAKQQLKLVQRTGQGLLLVFADLDGLKEINDTFGHQEGDLALIKAADVIKGTFRGSDIVARIGGDEFAVLVVDAADENATTLVTRLQARLDDCNLKNRHYTLSMSTGLASFNPNDPFSVERLLAIADEALYEQKRSKRESCLTTVAAGLGEEHQAS